MERKEIMDWIYGRMDEDARLSQSRHGQLEYRTTMHYIHRFVPAGAKVLEVGAGTGRYSVALAREGCDVTAVELVEHNLELLRRNGAGLSNLRVMQGDAVDLSAFAEGSFDATLVLGPLYHLYEPAEQHRALDEAIRVTRRGGVVMTAFLSVYEILYNNYLQGDFCAGVTENFDAAGRVRHFREQAFTGFDIGEWEALFAEKPVRPLALAGTDSVLEMAERLPDFQMSDEEFERFAAFHLATCEKRELLGRQTHLLHICEKC